LSEPYVPDFPLVVDYLDIDIDDADDADAADSDGCQYFQNRPDRSLNAALRDGDELVSHYFFLDFPAASLGPYSGYDQIHSMEAGYP
jgi:hypothetical protein